MIKHTYAIEIKSNTPLHSLGDGHIMTYDEEDKCYYAVTREQFLRSQNKRIDEIQNAYAVLESKFNDFTQECKEFMKEMTEKYSAFLKTYQETNAVVLDMVKTFVETKQEEN